MGSYERVIGVIRGECVDRPPVWASRHSARGAAEDAEELANREIDFQRSFKWDMMRISPPAALHVIDWGCEFEGANYLGVPSCVRYAVEDPSEWDCLRPLDPERGRLGEMADAIGRLHRTLGTSRPNLITAFSPLTIAQKLSGTDVLTRSLNENQAMLENALTVISDTVIDFIIHCADRGGDALYFSTQTANRCLLDDEQFERFELQYDLRILQTVRSRLAFTILHLHGDDIRIQDASRFGVDVLNWADRRTVPKVSLSAARKVFPGTLMGGVNGRATLLDKNLDSLRAEMQDAYDQTDGILIISPCCVIPVDRVPDANLHALANVGSILSKSHSSSPAQDRFAADRLVGDSHITSSIRGTVGPNIPTNEVVK